MLGHSGAEKDAGQIQFVSIQKKAINKNFVIMLNASNKKAVGIARHIRRNITFMTI